MLFNYFVWDDFSYIIFNPDIHTINLLSLLKANSYNHVGQYRAFTALYFALLYAIFTNSSFFYHVIQLCMHVVNTILVFYLFKKFFSQTISFFLSLVFLVHPLQVESVSFISASDNPLFFLFGIGAILLTFKKTIPVKMAVVIAILLFISLLTKETGIGFVFLTVLIAVLFQRKSVLGIFLSGLSSVILYSLIRFGIGGVYFDTSALRW
jgi:hypothetical protein